jgi:bifunctional non-homologous end joining protein LigD
MNSKTGKAQGLEGLVAKHRDSKYEPGLRSGAWQKMRVNQRQEFVIAGYTPSLRNFDALVIGCYEGANLIYAARTLKWLHSRVKSGIVQEDQAFGKQGMPLRESAREKGRALG